MLVGAVALAKEAKTSENGASNLITRKQRTNIKAKVITLSNAVIIIALTASAVIRNKKRSKWWQ